MEVSPKSVSCETHDNAFTGSEAATLIIWRSQDASGFFLRGCPPHRRIRLPQIREYLPPLHLELQDLPGKVENRAMLLAAERQEGVQRTCLSAFEPCKLPIITSAAEVRTYRKEGV